MTSWASGDHGRLKPELLEMNLPPLRSEGILRFAWGISVSPALAGLVSVTSCASHSRSPF